MPTSEPKHDPAVVPAGLPSWKGVPLYVYDPATEAQPTTDTPEPPHSPTHATSDSGDSKGNKSTDAPEPASPAEDNPTPADNADSSSTVDKPPAENKPKIDQGWAKFMSLMELAEVTKAALAEQSKPDTFPQSVRAKKVSPLEAMVAFAKSSNAGKPLAVSVDLGLSTNRLREKLVEAMKQDYAQDTEADRVTLSEDKKKSCLCLTTACLPRLQNAPTAVDRSATTS